tara:strand:- start:1897 stop:2283 length:387 start_codon:yes stop_codon:yes gene_type:complete
MENDILENKIKYTYDSDSPDLEVSVTPLLGGPHCILKINNDLIIDAEPFEFFTASSGQFLARNEMGEKFFEHLRVDGNIDYLPYTDGMEVFINFVNVGWRGTNMVRYLRIDPYTGAHTIIEEAPHDVM